MERRFTRRMGLEQRKRIQELLVEGNSTKEIAHDIGFSSHTVYYEVSHNGGRMLYNAEIANSRNIEKKKRVGMKPLRYYTKIKEKVDELDKCLQQLKELIND